MAIELQKINEELYATSKRLRDGASALYKQANAKAETERDYRIALSKSIIKLKEQGLPVTIIGDMARGECADLKYKRDLADLQYTASREALENLRVDVSALQTILKYQDTM